MVRRRMRGVEDEADVGPTSTAAIVKDASTGRGMVGMEDTEAGNASGNTDRVELRWASVDEYFEEAFASRTGGFKWRYWLTMASIGMANATDASEILCLSYILSNDGFKTNILGDDSWRGSLLASAVFCGMLLGGLVVGVLGDICGRRSMLFMGLCLNSVAGVLAAASRNVTELAVLRFIAGLGIGASVPPLFTLVTEISPPSRRGLFITVVASFWMVGASFVAGMALILFGRLSASWRIFSLVCALPTVGVAVLVKTLVAESPRFLVLENRQEEALIIINRITKQMKYTGPAMTLQDLHELYPNTLRDRSETERRIDPAEPVSNRRPRPLARCGLLCGRFLASISCLYARDLRWTTFPLQVLWFGLSFGSYGILTWINTIFDQIHLDDVYTTSLLFALANLPGDLLTAIFMDKISRRFFLSLTSLGGCLSLLLFAVFAHSEGTEWGNVGVAVSACAFQAFISASWNIVDALPTEVFPTSVRSTGMGVCSASGRIGAMVAQFVNGSLLESPVILLVVASAALLLAAVTPYLIPGEDPSNAPLSDGIGDYDDDDYDDDDDDDNGEDDEDGYNDNTAMEQQQEAESLLTRDLHSEAGCGVAEEESSARLRRTR